MQSRILGETVLVLEDEPLILLHVEAIILAAGGAVITANNVDRALALADDPAITLALLDLRVGFGNSCEPVFEKLTEHGIPFAFYTGCADPAITRRFPHVPIIDKPSSDAGIVRTLADMASKGSTTTRTFSQLASPRDHDQPT